MTPSRCGSVARFRDEGGVEMNQGAALGTGRLTRGTAIATDAGAQGTQSLAARRLAELVPGLIDGLVRAGSAGLYRDATRLFERPLFSHVLALTRGNQLRAARMLGLNRNTLRKRCRELDLPLPREAPRPPDDTDVRPDQRV
jgi:two-component system nitrogen regulation response regulator GlnG